MRGDYLASHTIKDLHTCASVLEAFKAAKEGGGFTDVLRKIEHLKSYKLHERRGLPKTIPFISDNPIELFKRAHILITAKKEGHNSSENDINAILKRF